MEIKTKYNIGEKVFFLAFYGVCQGEISGINVFIRNKEKTIQYNLSDGRFYNEEECFPSEDELCKHLKDNLVK